MKPSEFHRVEEISIIKMKWVKKGKHLNVLSRCGNKEQCISTEECNILLGYS